MHPTRPGSDLQTLAVSNREPVRVHPSTWQVLALAQEIWQWSDGIFDPCLPQRAGRFADVELRSDSTVLCRAPVAIDLGGIAKGFAIDAAVEILTAAGCERGIVNAGGDVRVFGPHPEPISIRRVGGDSTTIELLDAALAVSDRNAPHPAEHRGYYLRTDAEKEAKAAAAVIAKRAVYADALTKCALFCSPSTLRALEERCDAKVIGLY